MKIQPLPTLRLLGVLLGCLVMNPASATSAAQSPQPGTTPASPSPSPAHALVASSRPLVIGHRGYPTVAPENTLAAFRLALQAGADLVELDYHHSRDGVPIVIHDSTLDRTTDAPARWSGRDLRVDARDAADLLTLSAGANFQPAFPAEKVPSLVQALDFIQKQGVTLIERKAGNPETLADLLRTRALVNQLVVQAFDWAFLRSFHELLPDQVIGALGPPSSRDGRKLTDPEKALSAAWLREIRQLGAQLAVWNRQVDAPAVREAHSLGLKVWVYTINDHETAASLLAMGVDGIITDNPAVVWRSLALHPRSP